MTVWFAIVFAGLLICSEADAQRDANYDEAKVPRYTLPDPLVLLDGQPVRDAKTWDKRRRPEILHLFESNMYGRTMAPAKRLAFERVSTGESALAGKAVRKLVRVYFSSKKDGPKMDILIYLPSGAAKPVPIFLGLNFDGNQTVATDPGIPLGDVWERAGKSKTTTKHRATEESRGSSASRWQVEKILARGYGLATIYYGDIEPDFDGGMVYGVRPLFFKAGQTAPGADEWGAIGAWAWGLSRAVDYLATDKNINAKRIALIGHSRLGKTALWAGAQDARFALVISNCSGEGGAALSRRKFGEQPRHLIARFPYWFCDNYKKFSDREDDLPVDQHMLLALMAPRPVYVAAAEEDLWADPRGQFLAAVAAGPVYRLFGKQGIETGEMPPLHHPVGDTVAFHIRAGKHDVTAYDWDQYLDFADRAMR